ncbi:ribosome assembly factor SBDS [Candidatus Woesearchaeota archaeon]|jgi:ribosome maturation protein SDO1|nr:ribosome assembly factor SBDS [Candidatus Woesearchaeota archaeon]
MGQTLARINQAGKHFEIIVDLDDAIKFKKGESSFIEAEGDKIFTDSKKGMVASTSDLESSFKTTDVKEIVEKIIKNGEVQLTQEHRSEEREQKVKQVVNFLTTNAMDPQSGNPHTSERIKSALDQAHVNIKNGPIENQIKDIIAELSKVLPIKLETKRVKITIPAIHTGKAYGVITQYKEKEAWLDDGSLEVMVEVPAGIIMDFYDKLNSITHGSALTEEIKQT